MSKHALIVDDSRSARIALQKLLEKHRVEVSFAASGEEAIEFLQHQEVDAIFMDHTMPGMSGFEAVSAIKANPRTAMIPVMMYTAKEGEVYLGQARALGAIGVLPKELQPGVVFEMLLKLGLAEERRAGRRRIADPVATQATPAETTDQLLDRQALGVSIQALVTRILQDQHLELRSDILASNRDFAKRVAEEIHAKQAAEAHEQAIEAPPPPPPQSGSGRAAALLLAGLLPAAVLFLMWSQAADERDTAYAEQARLATAMEQQSALVVSLQDALMGGFEAEPAMRGSHSEALVEALEWAANHGNHFGYLEQPFDDVRLERLRELVTRLAAVGFTGTVRMDAYAGEFCLASDGAGGYQLAESDMSILDCVVLSEPPGRAGSAGDQQSIAFANFLASSPLLNDNGIDVQAYSHGGRASMRRHPFPPGIRTAGEWNRIAELNNRVEFTLIPAE